MKEKLTLKAKWKFVFAVPLALTIQLCYANFLPQKSEFQTVTDDCQIAFKSLAKNYKYVVTSETTFLVKVENNGSSSEDITLSVQNMNENCQNPDYSGNVNNVELNYELLDATSDQPVSKVTLEPGSSFLVKLKVIIPQKTPLLRWSCAGIKIVSAVCQESTPLLRLYTFVDQPGSE
jgi:hypothetical protein